jgi:hypothetical protein
MSTGPSFKLGDIVSWREKTEQGSEIFGGVVVQILEPNDLAPVVFGDATVEDRSPSAGAYRYVVELSRTKDCIIPDPCRMLLEGRAGSRQVEPFREGDQIRIDVRGSECRVVVNGVPLKKVRRFNMSAGPDGLPVFELELIGFDLSTTGFVANLAELPGEDISEG